MIGDPQLRNDWIKCEPFIYPLGEKEILMKPTQISEQNFINILLKRKSVKKLGACEKSKISELLFYSMKIHEIAYDDTGSITSRRICPSAGGRHPVDLFISQPEKNENRNLYYYNPIDHSLSKLLLDEGKLYSFIERVNSTILLKDAYLLWFSIQVEKTSSKYLNPESLYWRDVGCLLYSIQLISTYLGLDSCPIGTLAANSFDLLFNSKKICSGGGILVGNRI